LATHRVRLDPPFGLVLFVPFYERAEPLSPLPKNSSLPMLASAFLLCLALLLGLAPGAMAQQKPFTLVGASSSNFPPVNVLSSDGRLAGLSLGLLFYSAFLFKRRRGLENQAAQNKRTGEALRRSEEQFRGLVENIPGVIYRCESEPPWRFEHVSEEALSLTGYEAARFMTGEVAWADLIVEDDLAEVTRLAAEGVDKHEPFVMEYRIRHADGELRWVNEKGRAFYGEDGGALWLDGVILDITERKLAVEALKASEANYREIFNASNDAVLVHEAETGAILDVNRTMCAMFGYPYKEALKLTVNDISLGTPPYSQNEASDKIRRALEEGPQLFEWHSRKKSGELFWVEINLKQAAIGGLTRVVAVVRDITERQEVMEALTESEKNLAQAQKMARLGSWIWDMETGDVTWSREVYKLFGVDRDSFDPAKESVAACFHPGDRQLYKKVMTQASSGQGQFSSEARVLLPDGTVRHLNSTAEGSFDDEGNLKLLAGTVQDITERKQHEDSLKRSEKRYRDLVENASEGIMVAQSGLIKYVNPAVLNITGHTREEMINQPLEQTIHPDDRRLVLERHHRRMQGDTPTNLYAFRIMAKEDQVKWVEINAVSFEWEGRPAILNFITDVTERRRAAEALKESEERLRGILDVTPLPITITRKSDGKYRHVNQAYIKEFGFTWDEALGKTSSELNLFVGSKDRRKLLAIIEAEGRVHDHEMQYRTKDGSLIDVVLFLKPLLLDGEECLLAIVTDVTERKRAEEKRLKHEAQRRQSQKMEAMGTLAGGIAHDFNNMLAAMMGYTELTLQDLPDAGPEAENLKQVLKAGDRAKNLVRQILSFSRQSEQDHVPAELGPIVKEAVKLLRASIPSTIEIRQKFQGGEEGVLADPIQIHQLVMNLCTNSAQAMEEKGGLLQVGLALVDLDRGAAGQNPDLHPGRYLRLTVKDTGVGIDPKTLVRIFDPFFTTKEVDKGTGMGLAVVHGIVEGHGGAITVESQPGRGTTFNVYFPVLEGAEAPVQLVGKVALSTGTERILLVDDEEALADLGGKTLERLGYSVKTFTSSLRALKYFKAHWEEFDLVITDYTMPKMTGVSLAKEILGIRPGLPIIITTGFSQPLTGEKVRSLGIKRVLRKPLRANRMAQVVREVLDEGQVG
jgi:PAS domain S-box-containing protein